MLYRAEHATVLPAEAFAPIAESAAPAGLVHLPLRTDGLFVGRTVELDPFRQHRGETVACHRLAEGWRFTTHPTGPVIADADRVAALGDAVEAAELLAVRIKAAARYAERGGLAG